MPIFSCHKTWNLSLGGTVSLAYKAVLPRGGASNQNAGPCPVDIKFQDGNPSKFADYPRHGEIRLRANWGTGLELVGFGRMTIPDSSLLPTGVKFRIYPPSKEWADAPRKLDIVVSGWPWSLAFEELDVVAGEDRPFDHWYRLRQDHVTKITFEQWQRGLKTDAEIRQKRDVPPLVVRPEDRGRRIFGSD
jgi:hypothetical protein